MMRSTTYNEGKLSNGSPLATHGHERIMDDYCYLAANAILTTTTIDSEDIDTQIIVSFAIKYPLVDTFIGDVEKVQEFLLSAKPSFTNTLNVIWSKISPNVEDREIEWLYARWLRAASVFYEKGDAMFNDERLINLLVSNPKLLVFFLIAQMNADTLQSVNI